MKRKAIGVIIAAVLLAAAFVGPTATAHGTCTASASQPFRNGSNVVHPGQYGCGSTVHTISVTAQGQRRTPGQAWTNTTSNSSSGSGTFWTVQTLSAFNCNKDYRTVIGGAASPGVHSGNATSPILTHTC